MNLTDNEIIKALECCIDCKCKECPCCRIIDGGTHCTEIDEEAILDLINRQRAEIERLHEVINGLEEQSHKELLKFVALSEKYTDAKAEIERLQKEKSEIIKSYVDDEWN